MTDRFFNSLVDFVSHNVVLWVGQSVAYWSVGNTLQFWRLRSVCYWTSALWGRCPALTPLLQLITPSRASGTADHVRCLDDLLLPAYTCSHTRPHGGPPSRELDGRVSGLV